MNKRTFIKLLPSAVALSLGYGRKAQGAANELPRWTRVVSMSVLQGRLERCPGGICSDNAVSKLAGLSRLDGYVLDPANHDVLLVGRVEKGAPDLHTSDLVVALRSGAMTYIDSQRRYSHPGCSIDPSPETIKRLLNLSTTLVGPGSDENRSQQEWERTCQLPQNVRVIGLGQDSQTRVAAVYVSADYAMKRIVDSTDKVEGLATPSEMELSRIATDLKAGRTAVIRQGVSMSRYWFNAGVNRFATDSNGALLLQCDVRLSTEAQMFAGKGLTDSAQRDVLAEQCAASFTKRYSQIAATRQIYLELENMFRFQSVAVAVKKQDAFRRAGLDANYLLHQYRVPVTDVPRQLPGRSAIKGFDHRRENPRGYSILKVRLPSCGGVTVNVADKLALERVTSPLLAHQIRASLSARPRRESLYWDVA